MSDVRRGTLLSFDSSTWTAFVLLEGADVESQMNVGQWVPPDTMVAGVEVAALVFGDTNTDDGLVVGSYGAAFGRTVQLVSSGTWTPAWNGSTTAGACTYANQLGYWYRTGDIVQLWARLSISAITSAPTGNMQISGLPFASGSKVQSGIAFWLISQLKFTAAALAITGSISNGASVIALQEVFTNAASAAYPAANFTNAAADIGFTGSFLL